jgi:hypothetical protein
MTRECLDEGMDMRLMDGWMDEGNMSHVDNEKTPFLRLYTCALLA